VDPYFQVLALLKLFPITCFGEPATFKSLSLAVAN
jgi:hypothetical protein